LERIVSYLIKKREPQEYEKLKSESWNMHLRKVFCALVVDFINPILRYMWFVISIYYNMVEQHPILLRQQQWWSVDGGSSGCGNGPLIG
jgi:hypothetical protein